MSGPGGEAGSGTPPAGSEDTPVGSGDPPALPGNYELAGKVMLLGDSGVGKTCFLLQFKDGAFLSGTFIATVGIDFRNKVVAVDGVKVKLQIWDTAGQERFRSVTHAYYRDAQALLLLYDITSKMSFDNIRAWLTEIHEYAQKDVVIMLLGNKADVSSERAVRTEDGASLARGAEAARAAAAGRAPLPDPRLHRVTEEEICLLCLRLRAARRSRQP
ncbi:ras-related protein Rab-37 isoform X2 [Apus apus]|uniref:ras-related protein Rab-37 isoform X2 n=1 Tax=Apus apus TaxID=8895 RepID=UPI0021F91E29|nr:ras-related protein Rab-37 isoform X2 [Apus apus]